MEPQIFFLKNISQRCWVFVLSCVMWDLYCRLSSYGAEALSLQSMWDVVTPAELTVSCALQGKSSHWTTRSNLI